MTLLPGSKRQNTFLTGVEVACPAVNGRGLERYLSLEHSDLLKVVSDPSFGGFHDFIRDKYGFYESTPGWCRMLISVETAANGADLADMTAVDRFFDDLDEFRRQ